MIAVRLGLFEREPYTVMKRRTNSRPQPKMHYAPSLKRALCGLPNPRVAPTPEEVNCRMCKRWMRYLPVGATFRKSSDRRNKKPRNTKGASVAQKSTPIKGQNPLPSSPPKGFFHKLGQKIRLLRTKKGLTRAQLATSCRLWTGHIGKIERGDHNMTLLTLMRIASLLDTSAEALLAASLADLP